MSTSHTNSLSAPNCCVGILDGTHITLIQSALKADAEIAAISDSHRESVRKACENVIARFSPGKRTVTLYRPVGPEELDLITQSGWREFPPRLPDQPIPYPVTNEAYATQIARDMEREGERRWVCHTI